MGRHYDKAQADRAREELKKAASARKKAAYLKRRAKRTAEGVTA